MVMGLVHLEKISSHRTSQWFALGHLEDMLLILWCIDHISVPDVHVHVLSRWKRRHQHLRSLIYHVILQRKVL